MALKKPARDSIESPDADTAMAALFLEHGRWLFAYHNERGDVFVGRAMGLIGVVGAILALTLQAIDPTDNEVSVAVQVLLIATVVTLLGSAGCALRAVRPMTVTVVDVESLRDRWAQFKYSARPLPFELTQDLAERYLQAGGGSIVDCAKAAADDRVAWFNRATWALVIALVALAALLLVSTLQTQGR